METRLWKPFDGNIKVLPESICKPECHEMSPWILGLRHIVLVFRRLFSLSS